MALLFFFTDLAIDLKTGSLHGKSNALLQMVSYVFGLNLYSPDLL